MYGSILFNLWGALIGFTVYFLLSFQNVFTSPLAIILWSFVAAFVVFLAVFPVRILLHFVFFTPEQQVVQVEEVVDQQNEQFIDELPSLEQAPSNEFGDENAEEVAKAVRTMMHSEQAAS